MTNTSYHIAIWIGIGKIFSSVLGIKSIGKKWYRSTFIQIYIHGAALVNISAVVAIHMCHTYTLVHMYACYVHTYVHTEWMHVTLFVLTQAYFQVGKTTGC